MLRGKNNEKKRLLQAMQVLCFCFRLFFFGLISSMPVVQDGGE